MGSVNGITNRQYLEGLQGKEIKAISLQQPFATLLAFGFIFPAEMKQIETRDWQTSYRGPLAIHASKTMKDESKMAFEHPAIKMALRRAGVYTLEQLPLGKVLAIGELTHILKVVSPDSGKPGPGEMVPPAPPEYHFGDYGLGRFGWHFSKIVVLPNPIVYSGTLSVWPFKVPDNLFV